MKKISRFEKISRRCLFAVIGINILGGLAIRSIESSMNVEQQIIEEEIKALKSDIDGLDVERQSMTSFAHLNDIASKQGYSYTHNDVTAYVSGD